MFDNRNRHSMEEVGKMAERHSLENLPAEFNEKITEFAELSGAGKILDIGCGHGRDVHYFQRNGFQALGIDPSENMIKYAEKDSSNS